MTWIIANGTHIAAIENLRKRAFHDLAVFENVRNTRRAAQIIFQDVIFPVAVADQIGSGDVAPGPLRRLQSNASLAEGFCREDQVQRDDTILEDLLVMVNVVDKDIQRMNALTEPALDRYPFVGRNNPRNNIERKDLFRPRLIAVNIECDAHSEQRLFRGLLIPANLRVPD